MKLPFRSPDFLLYLLFCGVILPVQSTGGNIKNDHFLLKVDNYLGTFKKANTVILETNEVSNYESLVQWLPISCASLHISNPDLMLTFSHEIYCSLCLSSPREAILSWILKFPDEMNVPNQKRSLGYASSLQPFQMFCPPQRNTVSIR